LPYLKKLLKKPLVIPIYLKIKLMKNFSDNILKWYSLHKRSFPWRETKNAYLIWLSEIILQQTKTEQGLPYFQKFINTYPTIYDLAKASEQDVLKLWQGLGYYSRARNLHHTAKFIAYNLNGKFPDNYKDLMQLKGVGDYTASAIASICFNQKEAVLDGNVFRVLARYFGIETDIASGNGKKEFKNLAQELLPDTDFAAYNQAVMDFGATQCTPKKTNCTSCILQNSCFAYLNNKVSILPIKKKKNSVKKRYFNYIIFLDKQNNTLVYQRKNKDIWQNLFEFHLIEDSKPLKTAQILQSLKTTKHVKNILGFSKFNDKPIIHKLSHQHIHTTFWIAQVKILPKNSIPFIAIKDYPVSTLTHNFVESFINS